MVTRYYLIQSFDSNVEIPVDVTECPGYEYDNVSEKDALLAAVEQLGYIFCAKDDN